MDAVVSEIAGKQIQIPPNGLRGIVVTPIITPVPLAPPEVRGVAHVAGEIIPVLDLGVALQIQEMPAIAAERLLDAVVSDTRVLIDVGTILDDETAVATAATPYVIVDLEIVVRECSRRCGSGADLTDRP